MCRLKSLRFAAVAAVLQVAARHARLSPSGSLKQLEASELSDAQSPTRRPLLRLWRALLDVIKGGAGFSNATRMIIGGPPRRSSLKSTSTRLWRLKKRHVRFKGLPSTRAVRVLAMLVKFVRAGSRFAMYWEFLLACANAIGSLLLPMALLAREYVHSKGAWLMLYDEKSVQHAVSKHSLWASAELWLDIVFVADLLFRAAQAAVRDIGLEQSSMDSLVHMSAHLRDGLVADSSTASAVTHMLHEKGWTIGKALRRQVFVSIPLRIMFMIPMWLDRYMNLGNTFVMIGTLARTYRIVDLMKYFSERQEDLGADVRWIAFFKFSYIIFSTVRSKVPRADLAAR